MFNFDLPDLSVIERWEKVENLRKIPLEAAAETWAINNWNHRCSEVSREVKEEPELYILVAQTFGEDLYKTLKKYHSSESRVIDLQARVDALEKQNKDLADTISLLREQNGSLKGDYHIMKNRSEYFERGGSQ